MARIAGVDLPRDKRLEIGLTYIYGIGLTTSKKVIFSAQIDKNKKVADLTDEEIARLRTIIEREYKIEGTLRQECRVSAWQGVLDAVPTGTSGGFARRCRLH